MGKGNLFPTFLNIRCHFLNNPTSLCHSRSEFLLFQFKYILHEREIFSELRILRHILYVHFYNFGEGGPDAKITHHAQSSSEDETGQVSCLGI